MKVIFIIPFYKRLDLTDICFREIKKQGREVYTVGTGEECKELAKKHGVNYIDSPNNPVSNKHNKLTESLKNVDYDYAILIGSDNFVSSNFVEKLTAYLKEHKPDVTQFDGVYFYHQKDKVLTWFEGFTGVGRAYSKKVIEGCNHKLWREGLNKGLDTSSAAVIKSKGFDINLINMKELGVEILDVKYNSNLSAHAIVYQGQKVDSISIDLKQFENLNKYNEKVLKFEKMEKSKLVKVRFLKDVAGLIKGEEKVLSTKNAVALVRNGVAELVGVEDKPQPKAKTKAPAKKAKAKKEPCEDCDDNKPCKECEEAAETTNIPTRKKAKK
jgi:hypothetical protein